MFRFLLVGLIMVAWQMSALAAGQAKYFVLVVWDGMRPDFVTPELTPALYGLRKSGVWFANHHSVYPTSTEVNGTALATGVFPRRSGVMANRDYQAEIDPLKSFGTESFDAIRRGDEVTGGKYMRVSTLAEMVQADGGRTAVAGAKGVALLQDRLPRTNDLASPVWFATGGLPESNFAALTNRLGGFPAAATPNEARDTWATRCLTEVFWGKEMPRYSVLWLSEPDASQHRYGPGSPVALAAIRSSDQRLASVLNELDRRGIRSETDIIVVSDHGFSTIAEDADVAASVRAAGVNVRAAWDKPPGQDDVVSVGNGGSVLLYVIGKSPAVIQKIVTALQQRPSSGVIFTRAGLPGTFPLAEVMLDSPTAPDVLVASSWKMSAPIGGHPHVEVVNDGYTNYHAGGGMHVTLSPTDLHNTAVAAGPDFRRGVTSPLPSGNVDIVPTLVYLMGLNPPAPLDGRVLSEALVGAAPPLAKVQPGRREASSSLPDGNWQQYLKFTEVNGVRYLEEGNGHWAPAADHLPGH
ncbi:MAG: alkaline phosphatase family protein [Verrucomicrobiae bacterium]|nr:alkaline phosphatase family protein [Verrucomicrobiae bacterium]